MTWKPFPVAEVRRYLEPGPVLLVTSAAGTARNVMTLGWHMVMEFSPSLVACMIAGGNHSFGLIRAGRSCVLNLPTADMADTVARIGNATGAEIDKFAAFGLKTETAAEVDAPLLTDCHAAFECRLYDDTMVERYNVFVFEVVRAHVRPDPVWPETLHYAGGGIFRKLDGIIDRSNLFGKVS